MRRCVLRAPEDMRYLNVANAFDPSFFGAQEGEFSLSIKQISALSKVPSASVLASDTTYVDVAKLEEGGPRANVERQYLIRAGAGAGKVCGPRLASFVLSCC